MGDNKADYRGKAIWKRQVLGQRNTAGLNLKHLYIPSARKDEEL